jgi:hypothetical protein
MFVPRPFLKVLPPPLFLLRERRPVDSTRRERRPGGGVGSASASTLPSGRHPPPRAPQRRSRLLLFVAARASLPHPYRSRCQPENQQAHLRIYLRTGEKDSDGFPSGSGEQVCWFFPHFVSVVGAYLSESNQGANFDPQSTNLCCMPSGGSRLELAWGRLCQQLRWPRGGRCIGDWGSRRRS